MQKHDVIHKTVRMGQSLLIPRLRTVFLVANNFESFQINMQLCAIMLSSITELDPAVLTSAIERGG